MKLELFKSKLSKGQLEAMAIDTVKKQLESVSALDALLFAKKLSFFASELVKEAENEGKLVWDQLGKEYESMTYTQGGVQLNLNEFEYRKQIADHLKSIDEKIKQAWRSDEPEWITNITTGEIMNVPKVSVKGYRKDSINVRI